MNAVIRIVLYCLSVGSFLFLNETFGDICNCPPFLSLSLSFLASHPFDSFSLNLQSIFSRTAETQRKTQKKQIDVL